MTDTLLPCPFCGGEAKLKRNERTDMYHISCNCGHCIGAVIYRHSFCTEAEAIAAWNTRAERTCRVDSSISYDCMYLAEYEHELTCGHTVTTLDMEPPSYCPECGARVVS